MYLVNRVRHLHTVDILKAYSGVNPTKAGVLCTKGYSLSEDSIGIKVKASPYNVNLNTTSNIS